MSLRSEMAELVATQGVCTLNDFKAAFPHLSAKQLSTAAWETQRSGRIVPIGRRGPHICYGPGKVVHRKPPRQTELPMRAKPLIPEGIPQGIPASVWELPTHGWPRERTPSNYWPQEEAETA